jgi:DNA-binding transcriptional MerR regulator
MLSIGKLSGATGVSVPTIRYYEQIGILPQPGRSRGNQRLYDHPAAERLSFIRHARELGFSLEDIREFLALADDPEQPCAAVDRIAARQLAAVNARLRRLEALRDELLRMLDHGSDGRIADCRVIEVLGNHALCHHDHAGETGQGL